MSGMPKIKEIDTRKKIVLSALELFTESSYATVPIDAIAERAKVSKGAIFHYFDSKLDLAKEALRVGMEIFWRRSVYEQLNKCRNPEEKLWIIINDSLSSITDQSKLVKFANDLIVYCEDGKETINVIKDIWRKYIGIVENILNELDIPNSKIKACILSACIDGFIYQILILQDLGVNLDLLKQEIYNLFIGGTYVNEKKRSMSNNKQLGDEGKL